MEDKQVGYIINVWDPLNLQIMIDMDIPNAHSVVCRYENTQTDDTVEMNKMSPKRMSVLKGSKSGKVYRCRMKNLKFTSVNCLSQASAYTELMNKIYVCNGWCIVKIYSIDQYKRLIVELFDPVSMESYSEMLCKHRCIEKFC